MCVEVILWVNSAGRKKKEFGIWVISVLIMPGPKFTLREKKWRHQGLFSFSIYDRVLAPLIFLVQIRT